MRERPINEFFRVNTICGECGATGMFEFMEVELKRMSTMVQGDRKFHIYPCNRCRPMAQADNEVLNEIP